MLRKLTYNLQIALESISQNKLRSLLTSLGIIFGVASVIAMLAIGRGAQEKILDQLRILGTNNIVIKPVLEQDEEKLDENEGKKGPAQKRFSPGLTLLDAEAMMEMVPQVQAVSPEIEIQTDFTRDAYRRSGLLVGVSNAFFENGGFRMESGNAFSREQQDRALPVCVIGSDVRARFFTGESPLGQQIKVGDIWLTVIGVAANRNISETDIKDLGIRNYNMDIYVPVKTVLLRYKNRAAVYARDLERGQAMMFAEEGDAEPPIIESPNYHQLDRLTLTLTDTRYLTAVADVLSRMLKRRHNGNVDYSVIIPQELMQQKQETTYIFNMVLLIIGSISLLVGGIGIMNIMLASVMERIKEIGVRLSLGATRRDIVLQFLAEAVALSLTGGLLGILTGIGASYLIGHFTGITTVITPLSIFISFLVSITVGIAFGIFPASKAARQDPVISLRHE